MKNQTSKSDLSSEPRQKSFGKKKKRAEDKRNCAKTLLQQVTARRIRNFYCLLVATNSITLYTTVPFRCHSTHQSRDRSGGAGPAAKATDRESWCANVDLLTSPSPSVKVYTTGETLLLNIMNHIILRTAQGGI